MSNFLTMIGFNKPIRSNVTLLGAAGGIGQPLSMLLKTSPMIKQLNLFDVAPTAGIAMDVSHINTLPEVHHFSGNNNLKAALAGADVVLIVAGVTMKPGQSRDDLLAINAGIIKSLIEGVATVCPKAFIAIVSNPVNSNVPIAAEVMKEHKVFDEKKLFGVTTLDVMRSATFAAAISGRDPHRQKVPVIGGHSGHTIIPVVSQAVPPVNMSPAQLETYIKSVQEAGHKVLEAKEGKGTATLSMAYSAFTFVNSLLHAIAGRSGIIECAFVKSDLTQATYFASRVQIGREGIIKNLGLGTLTPYEKGLVDKAIPELIESIKKGEELAKATPAPKSDPPKAAPAPKPAPTPAPKPDNEVKKLN